jgi:hypothetical protein
VARQTALLQAESPVGPTSSTLAGDAATSSVKGVTLHHLTNIIDARGNLTAGEFGRTIPFVASRYFLVHGVPSARLRGEHAHRVCHQFLIAAHGSVRVIADDGTHREEFLLDAPHIGLHLPPLVWGVQHGHSTDAVLLVLASHHYDASDYIRDYDEFRRVVAPANPSPRWQAPELRAPARQGPEWPGPVPLAVM